MLADTFQSHADAWNMLHGMAQESWETEGQIDELHAAATNAKRSIENISKVRLIGVEAFKSKNRDHPILIVISGNTPYRHSSTNLQYPAYAEDCLAHIHKREEGQDV